MARQTISQIIQKDLKQKIMSGDSVASGLSLRELSRHYEVSVMPVRTAVRELVQEEVLYREKNGRLSVNPEFLGMKSDGAEQEAAGQAISVGWDGQELREAIIRLSVSGKSQYLRESAIAEQHGVGRTVVRRVLSQLAGEGLVNHVPRRGWWVHEFDEKGLLQYLQIREVVELKAMELAFSQMESEKLQVLMEENVGHMHGYRAALDNRLHAYWIQLSENRYIIDFFRQHSGFYAAMLEHAGHADINLARMASQHRQILCELLDQNLQGAQQALSEHIQSQHPNLLRMIQKLQDGRYS